MLLPILAQWTSLPQVPCSSGRLALLLLVTVLLQAVIVDHVYARSLHDAPFVVGKAQLDYSAANEYVQAHYGCGEKEDSSHTTLQQQQEDISSNYFDVPHSSSSKQWETVYNARMGVWQRRKAAASTDDSNDNQSIHLVPASLDQCGFTLLEDKDSTVESAAEHKDDSTTSIVVPEEASIDWTDLDSIRQRYLPYLVKRLQEQYGGQIQHILFWNPMRRRHDLDQTRDASATQTPTASYASSPHIDTDVNAYENAQALIDLLLRNQFPQSSGGRDQEAISREALVDCLVQGQRFCIVNAWRNIGTAPVQQAPLGLFVPDYGAPPFPAFPQARPFLSSSRWYTFPHMTPSETLLFCQYDRDVRVPSDVWHSALPSIVQRLTSRSEEDANVDPSSSFSLSASTRVPPRESFDVRCLLILADKVPARYDRFGPHRPASQLSLRESASFCAQQADQRR